MRVTLAGSGVVAQVEPAPAPETLGIAVVVGLVIALSMAYHARSNGRNWIFWGLVGFFLGIFGLVIYGGYLLVRSRSGGENQPDAGVAGAASGPADTRPRARSADPPDRRDEGARVADDDNQWRQVASEAGRTGTDRRQATRPGGDSSDDGRPGRSAGPGGTAGRGPADGGSGETAGDVGSHSGRPDAGRAGMAVELTYGDGRSDRLSGVTHIERNDRVLVVTRDDGTQKRYENGRVERVWDEDDG